MPKKLPELIEFQFSDKHREMIPKTIYYNLLNCIEAHTSLQWTENLRRTVYQMFVDSSKDAVDTQMKVNKYLLQQNKIAMEVSEPEDDAFIAGLILTAHCNWNRLALRQYIDSKWREWNVVITEGELNKEKNFNAYGQIIDDDGEVIEKGLDDIALCFGKFPYPIRERIRDQYDNHKFTFVQLAHEHNGSAAEMSLIVRNRERDM